MCLTSTSRLKETRLLVCEASERSERSESARWTLLTAILAAGISVRHAQNWHTIKRKKKLKIRMMAGLLLRRLLNFHFTFDDRRNNWAFPFVTVQGSTPFDCFLRRLIHQTTTGTHNALITCIFIHHLFLWRKTLAAAAAAARDSVKEADLFDSLT